MGLGGESTNNVLVTCPSWSESRVGSCIHTCSAERVTAVSKVALGMRVAKVSTLEMYGSVELAL